MINSVEHALYSPHGMMVTCAATMDLMCSPRFDVSELGPLREALWHAACMARYGNLLTTWRREIERGDFTSGVFSKAVDNGWLTRGELQEVTLEQVEQRVSVPAIEREFLNRWQGHRAGGAGLHQERHHVGLTVTRILDQGPCHFSGILQG